VLTFELAGEALVRVMRVWLQGTEEKAWTVPLTTEACSFPKLVRIFSAFKVNVVE
jgi:hypothetical protein